MATYYRCPSCGAIIPDDFEKLVLTCPNCRTALSKKGEVLDIIQLKKEEWKREIENRKMRIKEKNQDMEHKTTKWFYIGFAILCIIFFGGLCIVVPIVGVNSERARTEKLEEIVAQIQQNISDKDYDTALFNATRLRWDGEAKESIKYWDQQREEIIALIKNLQNP